MNSPHFDHDEMQLQLALVDFRTMKPKLQKAFVIAILDDYCAEAKEGAFDQYFAGQMRTRIELIAGFIDGHKPPQFRVVNPTYKVKQHG